MSNHALLQALGRLPGGGGATYRRRSARRLGLARHRARLGRRGRARATPDSQRARAGRVRGTAIILDGEEVRPILAKCYELLGFLAARNGAPASRDELLNALFDARDDESARSYLRKTIIGVRRLLPPDVLSVSADGRVALSPDIVLASESVRLEQQLAAAARLQGSELVTATEDALAPLARGEYFPGVRSAWVDDRRQQLAEAAITARAAAADAAYAADRNPNAQCLPEAVMAADPLREATWRTLMRIRSAVGDYDGVITTFAQCDKVLRAAGIAPAPSPRTLLNQLRR